MRGRRAAPDARAERGPPDLRGVRADVGEVRLEHHPAEPALVPQREPPAAGEAEREAVPVARRRRAVDVDPARHAQVQAEDRPAVLRLHPEELAAPVRPREPVPDERRGDLARRVRAAHVGVAVVHADDLASQDAIDLQARALGFRQLGHGLPGYGPARAADRADYARPRERRLPPRPRPEELPCRARLERAVPRQGRAAGRRRGLPRPRGRGRAGGQGARARAGRRRAARAGVRRPDRRGARQRDGHAALLPRPDRGRRAGGRPARRRDAPQGPLARGRRDDGQAARADRARDRAAARADRDRGADRGRHRPPRVRGDRRRVAADGDAGLRAGRLQRLGRHPRSRRSAARRRAIPATTSITSTPRSSSPRAPPASRRSTGRTPP